MQLRPTLRGQASINMVVPPTCVSRTRPDAVAAAAAAAAPLASHACVYACVWVWCHFVCACVRLGRFPCPRLRVRTFVMVYNMIETGVGLTFPPPFAPTHPPPSPPIFLPPSSLTPSPLAAPPSPSPHKKCLHKPETTAAAAAVTGRRGPFRLLGRHVLRLGRGGIRGRT